MRGMRGILYHGIYTRFLSKTNLFCTVTKPVSLVTIKVWTLSFLHLRAHEGTQAKRARCETAAHRRCIGGAGLFSQGCRFSCSSERARKDISQRRSTCFMPP